MGLAVIPTIIFSCLLVLAAVMTIVIIIQTLKKIMIKKGMRQKHSLFFALPVELRTINSGSYSSLII